MINQLSLSQLEHKARIENNNLALIILEKMEEELEESVENALQSLQGMMLIIPMKCLTLCKL